MSSFDLVNSFLYVCMRFLHLVFSCSPHCVYVRLLLLHSAAENENKNALTVEENMRESVAIILVLYASLMLCQDLNNRQQTIDEFIDQLAFNRKTESTTTIKPDRNPNQWPYEFVDGQNQGSTQLTFAQQPQQNAGQRPSYNAVSYPTSDQSYNRPIYNANVCAIASFNSN